MNKKNIIIYASAFTAAYACTLFTLKTVKKARDLRKNILEDYNMHHQSNQFDFSEERKYIKIKETNGRNYIKLTPKEDIKIYPDDYEGSSTIPEVPETEEVKIYEKK